MKHIIAATALSLMMSTAAFAQTTPFTTYKTDVAADIYASELIGMRVYSAERDYDSFTMDTTVAAGAETEWDDIGEVNDVILGRDGQVRAVILGVGGFIGIGEKDVALPMEAIKMVREADAVEADDFFLVVNANKELLTDAEEFRSADDLAAERQMATTQAEVNEQVAEVEADAAEAGEETVVAVEETAEAVGDTAAEGVTVVSNATSDAVQATEENVAEVETNVTEEVVEAEATDETVVVTTNEPRMDGDRTMLRTPQFERAGYVPVEVEDLTTEKLTGARVYGLNDEDIGEIDTLLLDDAGKLSKAVLGIGGFLGMGEHAVALTMDEVKIVRSDAGDDVRVYVDATKEELEAQPEYTD